MAVEIRRKLCLTAAWLRVDSRKELAAAFHGVNPHSVFDVQRAHKWVQGRAQPRGSQIYADWARLLGLDESAEWIAECTAEAFLERLCARHGGDPVRLRLRADEFGGAGVQGSQSRERDLVGSYACYSFAWSAYHRGHVVRSTLTIAAGSGAAKLHASYVENLPTGMLQLGGPVVRGDRVVSLQLGTPFTSAQLFLWLFAPAPPTAVMGGVISGTTLMSAETQVSACRMILIRIPENGQTVSPPAYLARGASIALDLADSGLEIAEPAAVDRAIQAFLLGGGGSIDQMTAADYRDVLDLFAPHWLHTPPMARVGDGSRRLVAAEGG